MSDRELVVHEGGKGKPTAAITERARGQFSDGQMELIRNTVAKDCNPAELHMFLELCARYDLDPFSKQVWAMKIGTGVQTVVSRDGLLALANRHTPSQGFSGRGEFLGCSSDVVREYDYFEKSIEEREDGSDRVKVQHHFRDKDGNTTTGGKDGKLRGEIVGAFAKVRREGHDDVFFFGYWAEYAKANVWKTNPSAMMQKVPETMVLRKAFSISGVIGETETSPRQVVTSASDEEGASGEIEWPENEELAAELRQGFAVLGYRRAKIRLLLAGKSEDEMRALLSELHAEADKVAEVVEGEPVLEGEAGA